ncbi:hypothetical protein N7448_006130 [Penicillium atrosanguineum]|nr:Sugar transporter [Penicillium atrosanguineum]KAJ5131972.1 hypothetical protein N7448_006130 [Penicillium atrosanguineum]KAJ5289638.1 Sugar transporter [Penicillium atrosanguineum]
MKVTSAVALASILTAAQAWHVKAPAAVQARHFGTSIPIPPPGEITSSIPLVRPSRTPVASSTPCDEATSTTTQSSTEDCSTQSSTYSSIPVSIPTSSPTAPGSSMPIPSSSIPFSSVPVSTPVSSPIGSSSIPTSSQTTSMASSITSTPP